VTLLQQQNAASIAAGKSSVCRMAALGPLSYNTLPAEAHSIKKSDFSGPDCLTSFAGVTHFLCN
jgi:hypothetical protein